MRLRGVRHVLQLLSERRARPEMRAPLTLAVNSLEDPQEAAGRRDLEGPAGRTVRDCEATAEFSSRRVAERSGVESRKSQAPRSFVAWLLPSTYRLVTRRRYCARRFRLTLSRCCTPGPFQAGASAA